MHVTQVSVTHLAGQFCLEYKSRDLGCIKLQVPGRHNVMNAAAAVTIALELDVPIGDIREALAGFGGVDRRFQIKGSQAGVTVIDDYGHHPTEIRATLAAARACNFAHVHVLFQPHRYSRTQALMDDFARAFHDADTVHLLDIYAASEAPIEGVTSQALASRMQQLGHAGVHYAGAIDAGIQGIVAASVAGDAALTLGAGSVSQTGPKILEALGQRN
jgi:UDP-N-acetylmuramate--alanine ligase